MPIFWNPSDDEDTPNDPSGPSHPVRPTWVTPEAGDWLAGAALVVLAAMMIVLAALLGNRPL